MAKSPRVPWNERNQYTLVRGRFKEIRVNVPGMTARVVDSISLESLAAIQRYLLVHKSQSEANDVLRRLSHA